MRISRALAFVVLLTMAATLTFAQSSDEKEKKTLESQISEFARRIERACKEHEAATVTLRFEEPIFEGIDINNYSVIENAQSNLRRLLIEEIGKLDTPELKAFVKTYKVNANAELRGEDHNGYVDKENRLYAVFRVSGELTDRQGESLETIDSIEISREADELVRLFGLAFGEPPPNADPPSTNADPTVEALFASLEQPSVAFISGTKVISKEDGNFSMELVVNGQPMTPSEEDGVAFVGLKKDDKYVVRVYNDADYEVAVQLNIDGLSSNHFRKQDFVRLVKPGGWSEFQGWRVSGDTIREFCITPIEESEAGRLGLTSDVGVIQAQFRRSWPESEPAPKGEYGSKSLGTGAGAEIQGRKVQVEKRNYGKLKASVVIRYVKQ